MCAQRFQAHRIGALNGPLARVALARIAFVANLRRREVLKYFFRVQKPFVVSGTATRWVKEVP